MFFLRPNVERMAERKDVKGLIKALSFKKYASHQKELDVAIRKNAAKELGRIQSPLAVESLIAALNDKNVGVCICVTQALNSIKDTRAIGPLFYTLFHDSRSHVADAAGKALANIRDPQIFERLIKELVKGSDDVRAAAANCLGEFDDSSVIEPLLQALTDNKGKVRSNAAYSLGKLRSPRGVEPLIKVLSDDDKDVRFAAIDSLGKLKDPQAIKPLLKLLLDIENRIRGKVANVLNELGESKWKEIVRGENRLTDISSIGETKDLRFVKPLIEILKEKDKYVREYAVEALGELGDPCALESLIDLLGDIEYHVQVKAQNALLKLNYSSLNTALLKLVRLGNIRKDTHLYLKLIQFMTEKGADINTRDDDGDTVLILAVKKECDDVIKLLIEMDADINIKNNNGESAFGLTLQKNDTYIAEMMITNGADVNEKINDNRTALLLAMQKNNLNIAKLLLEKGADSGKLKEKTEEIIGLGEQSLNDTSILLKFIEKYILFKGEWSVEDKSGSIVENNKLHFYSCNESYRQVVFITDYYGPDVYEKEETVHNETLTIPEFMEKYPWRNIVKEMIAEFERYRALLAGE